MKTLTIHRRELPRYLSWYLILLPLFSGIFLDLLGLPGALRCWQWERDGCGSAGI